MRTANMSAANHRPHPLPDPQALAACHVLVAGDAMLDRYWFGEVERISPEAPVPVVQVMRQEERPGGAANVALNLRRLGAQVTLLAPVGMDEPGQRLHALLDAAGVAQAMPGLANVQTILKLRVIGRSQQLLRADFDHGLEAGTDRCMHAPFAAALQHCGVVLLSDYAKGAMAGARAWMEAARAAGRPVLVDPKGVDFSRYSGATVVTPNRAELAQEIGRWRDEQDLQARVHRLRQACKLDAVLLTRSEEGMTLFDEIDGVGARLDVPAVAREVFDVTGAGDTVVAVLAAMMGCGLSLREAVPIANRAAALVVGRFGTASVTHQELFA